MTVPNRAIGPELRQKIVDSARAGLGPEAVLQHLIGAGWDREDALEALQPLLQQLVAELATARSLPMPVPVPSPVGLNGPSRLALSDRSVSVLAALTVPRIVVFGNLLDASECGMLIDLARRSLTRSSVVDASTGASVTHRSRTSEGTTLPHGTDPLIELLERRMAELVQWPIENGEPLQVLRYGPGAEYQPHYDYFDPGESGAAANLAFGGQRVASLVMYLNTPASGGATVFPDARFEVAAVEGNAVFFSYDIPHPVTRTLHGGAPVIAGEKWIATKWLRERPCR